MRRPILALAFVAAPLTLSGCVTDGPRERAARLDEPAALAALGRTGPDPRVASMYAAVTDAGWAVPAVDPAKLAPRNVRQVVDYRTTEPAGTIVVDPQARFLYLVQAGGKAMR